MPGFDVGRMEISIVGLGLVGGSIAKALRDLGALKIWGIDLDSDALLMAEATGAIDGGYHEPQEPLSRSDLVFICLHPGKFLGFLEAYSLDFKPAALLTDTAGIRRGLNAAVRARLRKGLRFVGGHPMAGKEDSGFRASDAGIFKGASYILTPDDECDPGDVESMRNLAFGFGCSCVRLAGEEEHDRMIAYTSHLPHLIASALVRNPLIEKSAGFWGGSFRDATRVAKINPELWTELFMSNRESILESLGVFERELGALKECLNREDTESLGQLLDQTRKMNECKFSFPDDGRL